MSLLKKSKSRKLQSLVMASVLALGFSHLCNADDFIYDVDYPRYTDLFDIHNVDFSRPFELVLDAGGVGRAGTYLFYTPTDRVVNG